MPGARSTVIAVLGVMFALGSEVVEAILLYKAPFAGIVFMLCNKNKYLCNPRNMPIEVFVAVRVEVCRVANLAAGIVACKHGAAIVMPEERFSAFEILNG